MTRIKAYMPTTRIFTGKVVSIQASRDAQENITRWIVSIRRDGYKKPLECATRDTSLVIDWLECGMNVTVSGVFKGHKLALSAINLASLYTANLLAAQLPDYSNSEPVDPYAEARGNLDELSQAHADASEKAQGVWREYWRVSQLSQEAVHAWGEEIASNARYQEYKTLADQAYALLEEWMKLDDASRVAWHAYQEKADQYRQWLNERISRSET